MLETERIESDLEPLPPDPLTRSQRWVTHFGEPRRRVSQSGDMVRFAEVFPDIAIVQSLIAQLGCTHFLHTIRLAESTRTGTPYQTRLPPADSTCCHPQRG